MKRLLKILCILTIPLLLAGCGEREAKLENCFERFRRGVIDAEKITLRASLTADSGETVEHYVVDAAWDGSTTSLKVVEPALIAGVGVTARRGETELSYGDVMIGAGPLNEDGITPVSAVPAILEAMAGGYAELLWWDADSAAARLYAGEDSRCTVWLDAETLTPTHAEISSDGRTIISCELSDWTVTSG